MISRKLVAAFLGGLLVLCGIQSKASAEVSTLVLADQLSLAFLPAIVMRQNHLLEKHLKAAGLEKTNIKWATFAGGSNAIDAMLSGNLHIAFTGFMPFTLYWAKTGAVRGIAATSAQPEYFNTRNPNIKSIKDLTGKDKIGLPAVKISTQATFLQMLAAKEFGEKNWDKLDHLTVSMSQPDATSAVLSGEGAVDVAFVSQPYTHIMQKDPRIHTVFNTFDILGGPSTLTVAWTSIKFHKENPKTYQAFLDAYGEAMSIIASDKHKAAQAYIDRAKSKLPVEDVVAIISSPDVIYSETPQNTMQVVKFMHKIGRINKEPASWKEMWFPNAQKLKGS
ncbi:MAG TPA: ABC transporter substrate-binding protein [Burkholderiales bacterium]|jgi:NitT/TauT family transport system substrate-binding protein|nr:ABC transporter substrate-binding protein [Burkholderiales bacterium]